MKKYFSYLILLILVITLIGCGKVEEKYQIQINPNLPLEFIVDTDEFDLKTYFTITDSKGKNIEVLDSMITGSIDFSKAGTYTITIIYKGQSEQIKVEIKDYSKIEVNSQLPTKFYVNSEMPDFKTYFTISNPEGQLDTVTDAMLDISQVDFTKVGTYPVKLTYRNLQKTVNIEVVEKPVEAVTYEIKVNDALPKTFYVGTAPIDFLTYFTILDSNGVSVPTSEAHIDATAVNWNQAGTYSVKITYLDQEATLMITIIPMTYTINVNDLLPKTFVVGHGDVDFTTYFTIRNGLGNLIPVTEAMITANVDFNQPGSYTVTIAYEDVSYTLNIVVKAKYASDLFISEYFESTNSDKYIELFNGTGKTIDLSHYKLVTYAKDFNTPTHQLKLTGELADGATLVIYNRNANKNIKDLGDIASDVANFNGDDVIALYKNGVLIDLFGDISRIGTKTGWAIGGIENASMGHTIIRKSSVKGPNSSWDATEWQVLGKHDLTNIKRHVMDDYDDLEAPEQPTIRERDLMISEYFEGSGVYKDTKYIEIYNGLEHSVDLSQYSLALYSPGSKVAKQVTPLKGTLSPGEVYIVYAPYSADEIKQVGHLASEAMFFGGNETIALLKDGRVIDIIGQIGADPGVGFEVGDGYTTKDNVLIRKKTVFMPNSTWSPEEWDVCFENYLYDLGKHDHPTNPNWVITDFSLLYEFFADLKPDKSGNATSSYKVKLQGTIYMQVANETALVYITDGSHFIKLHGEKIHNYARVGAVYEVEANVALNIYQPSLTVGKDGATALKLIPDATPVMEIDVYEVSLNELIHMKRENISENLYNGYLLSMLKITGYVFLDTHNSNRYDYLLSSTVNISKNQTQYIKDVLYLKNDIFTLEPHLAPYEVVNGREAIMISFYGVIYDWNSNRANWRLYLDEDLTISFLPE